MPHKIMAALLTTSLWLTSPCIAAAQDSKLSAEVPPETRYADIEAIPEILRQNLYNGGNQYRENYIVRVLSMLRQGAGEKPYVTQADADALKEKARKQRQRQTFSSLLVMDEDFDGRVTREEVRQHLEAQYENRRQKSEPNFMDKQISRVMAADTDNDGVLTLKEMATVPELEKSYGSYRNPVQIEDLLKLDPNGDGKLMADELETLALKAFRTVDTDGDGRLSQDELQALVNLQKRDRDINRSFGRVDTSRCQLPAVPKDSKIVVLGVNEGHMYSSVSVAGQEAVTYAASLSFSKGADPLYAVVAASSPFVWDVTGDTSRVTQLAVIGPRNDKQKIMAGVRGLSADKIVFAAEEDCLPGLLQVTSRPDKEMPVLEKAMTDILKRKPDILTGSHYVVSATVTGFGVIAIKKIDRKVIQTVREGFDAETWRILVAPYEHDLAMIDVKEVVSGAALENYQSLPGGFGIAKLVQEGALQPLDTGVSSILLREGDRLTVLTGIENIRMGDTRRGVDVMHIRSPDYKVVRDIGYYPVGLSGYLSPQFILAKDIPPPKGSSGSNCAKIEGSYALHKVGNCQ